MDIKEGDLFKSITDNSIVKVINMPHLLFVEVICYQTENKIFLCDKIEFLRKFEPFNVSEETLTKNEIKKCSCNSRDLFNFGCKCNGI